MRTQSAGHMERLLKGISIKYNKLRKFKTA